MEYRKEGRRIDSCDQRPGLSLIFIPFPIYLPHYQLPYCTRYDWFHVILRVETWKSLLALLSLWTVLIIVFAGFYVAVDRHDIDQDCGLGDPGFPIGFGPAFAFSLETCTTGMYV